MNNTKTPYSNATFKSSEKVKLVFFKDEEGSNFKPKIGSDQKVD